MGNYIERDANGKVEALYVRPQYGKNLDFLEKDHADMVAFRTERAMQAAISEVKEAAQMSVRDIERSVTKAAAKGAFDVFRDQLQSTVTVVEVDAAKSAAISAIGAL